MNLHDFYYDLPEELIAQDPLADRSSSRLMVLDKKTGRTEHRIFILIPVTVLLLMILRLFLQDL